MLDINKLFATTCSHNEWQGVSNKCHSIIAEIQKNIDTLTTAEFELILVKLVNYTTKKRNSYSYNCCVSNNTSSVVNIIKLLCSKVDLNRVDQSIFLNLVGHSECNNIILELGITKTFSNQVYLAILSQGKSQSTSMINFALEKISFDKDAILTLVKVPVEKINTRIAHFLEKGEVNLDNSSTKSILLAAAGNLPYSKDVLQYFYSKDPKLFNDEVIITVCEFCDNESLDFIYKLSKIKPNKLHFDKIISTDFSPRRHGRSMIDSNTRDNLQALIDHGYKFTHEDVLLAIQKRVEIPNLPNLLTKEDLQLCYTLEFIPNYNFEGVDKDLVLLYKLCNERHKPAIVKFLKEKKVVPDTISLEIACKKKNNKAIIELLIEKGAKVSFTCIENSARAITSNSSLLTLIESYKKLDVKVSPTTKAAAKAADKAPTKAADKTPVKAAVKAAVKAPNKFTALDHIVVPVNKTILIPEPKKYLDYFKIKKSKNNKSFLDVRYSILKKLVNKDNILEIPEELQELLNIEGVTTLDMDKLDKLVALFYS